MEKEELFKKVCRLRSETSGTEMEVELFTYCLRKLKNAATAQDCLILGRGIGILEEQMTILEVHANLCLEALDDLFFELQTVELDVNLVAVTASRLQDAVNKILKAQKQNHGIATEHREDITNLEKKFEEDTKHQLKRIMQNMITDA